LPKETLENAFLDFEPELPVLKARFPHDYAPMLAAFSSGYSSGQSFAELRQTLRTRLLPAIRKRLPQASEDDLLDMARLLVAQYRHLQAGNVRECYNYASGKDFANDFAWPSELSAREENLNVKVLQSAIPRPPIPQQLLDDVSARIAVDTATSLPPEQFALLGKEDVSEDEYGSYCALSIFMMEDVLRQPKRDAVAYLRALANDLAAADKSKPQ
jgi:hypothetical protein